MFNRTLNKQIRFQAFQPVLVFARAAGGHKNTLFPFFSATRVWLKCLRVNVPDAAEKRRKFYVWTVNIFPCVYASRGQTFFSSVLLLFIARLLYRRFLRERQRSDTRNYTGNAP